MNEGIPLSWYDAHNRANEGMTLEELEADESERFGAMVGNTIEANARTGDTPIELPMVISVQSVITEKELAESEGFESIRLPIRDHSWPEAETIDAFILFVKSIDPEQSWLHFHCMAGRGYPEGLKGKNIPEHVRVITIAVAYDAMNSDRVYRKALPKELIRKEMEEGSGAQFDPDYLPIFLKMMDEGVV